MNERIPKGQEMIVANKDMESVIRIIMDHALFTRPEEHIKYRPYETCEGVGFVHALGCQKVNLNVRYPHAVAGDGVISDFYIACKDDENIYLNVTSNVKVWFEGNCIYDGINHIVDTGERLVGEYENSRIHLPISVKKGASNPVRILCVKEEG